MSEEVEKQTDTNSQDNFVVEKLGQNGNSEEVDETKEVKKTTEEESTIDSEKKEAGTENKKPRKNRAKERIEKLSREKRELLKEIDELKSKGAAETKQDEDLDPDDFDDYYDYLEAVEKTEKVESTQTKKPEQTKQDDGFQEILDEIEVKFDEARDIYDDFDELVQRSPEEGGPTISMQMVEVINEVDNSGDVAYALAKDVNNSIRISNLSKMKQMKEILKLSDSLTKDKKNDKKETKKTTNAPEPINALGGGEIVQKTIHNSESFSDFEKQRQADNSSSNW